MNENKELFEIWPVQKAVIALVIPTVISQLITVAYNMADTFFIGQVGDPNQVAAVSLCMPLFILLDGYGKSVRDWWRKPHLPLAGRGEHTAGKKGFRFQHLDGRDIFACVWPADLRVAGHHFSGGGGQFGNI